MLQMKPQRNVPNYNNLLNIIVKMNHFAILACILKLCSAPDVVFISRLVIGLFSGGNGSKAILEFSKWIELDGLCKSRNFSVVKLLEMLAK
ncbi:hypothetical protein LIER_36735 [Lithospermum erythrorhizon]|uniref:Pentatricopeptide repeat-containing protein n=1 Tax=Lithospermum erythrorhizon TaxID=34254 RepID=A0AAV3PBS3_LITER